ncbi:MAG: hypothetical protein IH945_08060, partial [Armatimonadetes bacterium]|nr:hypothetical protein [Armatimonadota bacterium]
GPTAFLATVGAVVVLMGLLVLLAIPAARHFDRKEAEDEGRPSLGKRESDIKTGSVTALGTGAGLIVLGVWLGRRKARSESQR